MAISNKNKNYNCKICDKDCVICSPYMVHNELWLSIFDKLKDGIICLTCFEKKLNRELK